VLHRNARVEIRLPYLAEVSRDLLQLRLGRDTQVTRVAVSLPMNTQWQPRLLSVLEKLAEQVAFTSPPSR
jgi:hypothetical protein